METSDIAKPLYCVTALLRNPVSLRNPVYNIGAEEEGLLRPEVTAGMNRPAPHIDPCRLAGSLHRIRNETTAVSSRRERAPATRAVSTT
jgi:hypothetical protein